MGHGLKKKEWTLKRTNNFFLKEKKFEVSKKKWNEKYKTNMDCGIRTCVGEEVEIHVRHLN